MIYYYYLSLLFVCAHMCECVHGMEMLVPVCMHAEAREGCQVFSFIILHLSPHLTESKVHHFN